MMESITPSETKVIASLIIGYQILMDGCERTLSNGVGIYDKNNYTVMNAQLGIFLARVKVSMK